MEAGGVGYSPQSKVLDQLLLPEKTSQSVNLFLSGTMVGAPDTWCGVNLAGARGAADLAQVLGAFRLKGVPQLTRRVRYDICMGPGNGNPATTTPLQLLGASRASPQYGGGAQFAARST